MKKLFYVLMFFCPFVAYSQQNGYKSPLDYIWKNVGNAGFSAGEAMYTSLAFNPSNGQPYVAYEDYANGQKATVMMFNGSNWVNVGNAGFSINQAPWTCLAFSPSNNQPYIAYDDLQFPPNGRGTVMRFDGTNWVNVGNAGFSTDYALCISLVFNPSNNQPCVAFLDGSHSWKATVMQFDGTYWGYIGNEGFSAGAVTYTSLAFSPSGQPYVAFADGVNNPDVIVMKFDGTNWMNVGNAVDSGRGTNSESLAFSPTGQPYIAYQLVCCGAVVKKFDGTNWVYVGNEGFSACTQISLAFNPSDSLPYVATSGMIAQVMKFNGTNWVDVGNEGVSAGQAVNTSLAFNQSGLPYIAYGDYFNGHKATVMKYDSVMVGINESKESKFSLYPNPVTDEITIEIAEDQTPSHLSIVNVNGEDILTRSLIKTKTQIDISNLSSGVYFVRLTGEKSVAVGKFIKQ